MSSPVSRVLCPVSYVRVPIVRPSLSESLTRSELMQIPPFVFLCPIYNVLCQVPCPVSCVLCPVSRVLCEGTDSETLAKSESLTCSELMQIPPFVFLFPISYFLFPLRQKCIHNYHLKKNIKSSNSFPTGSVIPTLFYKSIRGWN